MYIILKAKIFLKKFKQIITRKVLLFKNNFVINYLYCGVNYLANNEIKKHYNNLASIYEQLWFYNEDFVQFTAKKIIDNLDVKEDDQLVDLGCGTGIYSKAILKQIKLNKNILCVDVSEEMLKSIGSREGLTLIVNDAIQFSKEPRKYNKIFIKEMIHHINEKYILFSGIYNQLKANGQLLILMLPPKIDYPLFKKALDMYEKLQPHYDDIRNQMEKAGFKTRLSFIEYPLSIKKETYFDMVKKRYMSLLSNFNDEEICKGIDEMSHKYRLDNQLQFVDRFVLLNGFKER